MLCDLGTVVVLFVTALIDPTAEAASVLEKRVIAERMKITSGTFEVEVEGWEAGQPGRQHFDSATKIVLDGPSMLNDIHRLGVRPTRDLRSWGPETVVFYTDMEAEGGGRFVANVNDLESAKKLEERNLIDPRLLGIYPANFLNLFNANLEVGLLSNGTLRIIEVKDEQVDGRACKQISRELINGVLNKIVIDPAQDYSVIRQEARDKSSGSEVVSIYRTELSYFPAAKRWFPTSCVFESRREGEVVAEEKLTIRVEGLNQPVDKRLFSLALMEIPKGTGIQAMGALARRGITQWNGKEIISMDPTPKNGGVIPSRTIYLGLAVVLSILAAVIAWKAFSPGFKSAR